MPANSRWDLIRRLRVKNLDNKRPFGSCECRQNYSEGVCVGLD